MLFFNNTDPKANQGGENRSIQIGQIMPGSRWSFSPVLSDYLLWFSPVVDLLWFSPVVLSCGSLQWFSPVVLSCG
jgi:hypothetical protein